MRKRYWLWLALWLFVFGAIGTAAQDGAEKPRPEEEFLGTWTGTWDGAGTGTFEMTLEKDAKGAVGGKVAVTGEPAYTATFKTLAFDGKKMSATYDFPPDERGEVVLAASFDGKTAKGTWLLREKGGSTEFATGTWTVSRK